MTDPASAKAFCVVSEGLSCVAYKGYMEPCNEPATRRPADDITGLAYCDTHWNPTRQDVKDANKALLASHRKGHCIQLVYTAWEHPGAGALPRYEVRRCNDNLELFAVDCLGSDQSDALDTLFDLAITAGVGHWHPTLKPAGAKA